MKKRSWPIGTISLVIINVFLFILFGFDLPLRIAERYGLVPVDLFRGLTPWSLITHMFIHQNFLHIFFNMIMLLSFGYLLEKKIGTSKFLLLYFLSGIFGGLAHSLFYPNSYIPLVGASGAIFGLMGAAAFLDPTLIIYVFLIPMPIILFAALYFFIATYLIEIGVTFGIGHAAHIGGMLFGSLSAFSINPRKALKGLGYAILTFIILIAIIFLVPDLIPSVTEIIKQPQISYSWNVSTGDSNSTHVAYYVRNSIRNDGYDTAKNIVVWVGFDSLERGVTLGQDTSTPYDIEPNYLFIIPSVVIVRRNVTTRAHVVIRGDNIPIKESYSDWFKT